MKRAESIHRSASIQRAPSWSESRKDTHNVPMAASAELRGAPDHSRFTRSASRSAAQTRQIESALAHLNQEISEDLDATMKQLQRHNQGQKNKRAKNLSPIPGSQHLDSESPLPADSRGSGTKSQAALSPGALSPAGLSSNLRTLVASKSAKSLQPTPCRKLPALASSDAISSKSQAAAPPALTREVSRQGLLPFSPEAQTPGGKSIVSSVSSVSSVTRSHTARRVRCSDDCLSVWSLMLGVWWRMLRWW